MACSPVLRSGPDVDFRPKAGNSLVCGSSGCFLKDLKSFAEYFVVLARTDSLKATRSADTVTTAETGNVHRKIVCSGGFELIPLHVEAFIPNKDVKKFNGS